MKLDLLKIEGPKDFHMHTTYCDGKSSVAEMLESAAAKGLKAVGISGHGYTDFDLRYCMSVEDCFAYEKEIRNLAKEYAGRMDVYCGIEQDIFGASASEMNWLAEDARNDADDAGDAGLGSVEPGSGETAECSEDVKLDWDYVIGSVHYIRVPAAGPDAPRGEFLGADPGYYEVDGWAYIPMDDDGPLLQAAAERYFGGDIYGLCEEYFRTVAQVVEVTDCDLIGHFDLVSKLNTGGEGGSAGALFDESHPRYVAAWKAAADKLLQTGVPFEINTGAISRGYRKDPYPSLPIREYIKEKGGRLMMSSDSHKADTICSGFDVWEEI